MFTEAEAREYRTAHDHEAIRLTRMTKAALEIEYNRTLAAHGITRLYGGPGSKDELISSILSYSYPNDKLNESIHVLYHTEWKLDVCEYCNAQPPF
jgi:hypothetical protein